VNGALDGTGNKAYVSVVQCLIKTESAPCPAVLELLVINPENHKGDYRS
jgi:hypothetical protein